MSNLESLTDSQRSALTQLQSLTNGGDIDVEIAILESVDWDVQRAAEEIFGNTSGEHQNDSVPEAAPSTSKRLERMELDDSHQWQPPTQLGLGIRFFRYPISFTFGLFSSILNFVFRILRIPFPSITSIWRPSSARAHLPRDPASVADRWVRRLEEETGANRARYDFSSYSTGAEAGPGPSTLSRRSEAAGESIRLPDFYLGSYEEALRVCQQEARVLCCILVSEEHDDVPDFKRTTLVDQEFNTLLKSNNFLVWGGDVRDRDAYQASHKLSATTYPFVAFVALQPRPRAASSTGAQSPSLMILSRHQGPSNPNSTSAQNVTNGPTSARALCYHINTQLLPRVMPFLSRLQETQRQRELDRKLREAQDNAFAESAMRDREKQERRMAEERSKKLEEERVERMKLEEDRLRKAREAEETKRREKWLEWCRYARRALLPLEPAPTESDIIKLVLRLPSGERLVRIFKQEDTLTTLFTFITVQFLPSEYSTADDPSSPPDGYAAGESGVTSEQWPFTVASSYPRKELKWQPALKLKDVELLKGGAQLVVETKGRSSNGSAGVDDDEYDTEEE